MMETTRKLATITAIKALRPIDGADKIEVATMTTNSWQVVVGKGEFKVGDKAIYFEIDSFLPKEDRYAILDGRCNKTMDGQEGYRLRTIRLRGAISQGFLMPLSKFTDVIERGITIGADGSDVTKELGVQLWTPPFVAGSFFMGEAAGSFPTHIVPKTDQIRIQSMGKEIMDMLGHTFEVTEKIDGTSCTMAMHRKEIPTFGCHINPNTGEMTGSESDVEYDFYVCSRNLQVKAPCVYWNMVEKYNLQERLEQWCEKNKRSIAIQGEICGPGIQGNPLKLPDVQFFVFDIYDVDNQRYLAAGARHGVVEELNAYDGTKIQHVPLLGYQAISPNHNHIIKAAEATTSYTNSYIAEFGNTDGCTQSWSIFTNAITEGVVDDLIKQAEGKAFAGSGHREGLVFKSVTAPSVSFKVINNQFLLAEKD